MLNRLSIKGRMYLIIVSILVLFVIMIGFTLDGSNNVRDISVENTAAIMLEAQKEKIKVATHSVALTLVHSLKGVQDEQDRIETIRRQLAGIRFEEDQSGYFFVNHGTVSVSHVNESLHGKDLKGTQLIEDLDDQARNGGGFVSYVWDKPGVGETPKISYAQMIPGTDYWIGTGVYLDNIDEQKTIMTTEINRKVGTMTLQMVIISGIVFLIIVFLCLAIVFGIGKSLNYMIASFKDIAEGEGDLTKRIEINSRDELKILGDWYNLFLEKLQKIIQQLARNSEDINHSSSDLVSIATQLAKGASDTSGTAGKVAASADEMSSNLSSVAAAMEESSTNANMVASAAEEMNATINEIAQNAEKARNISGSASRKTSEAEETMVVLSEAARSIGKVTDTIAEISDQTNLLALNATIEAARAGEAGKGFAVVANEIKELANQTVAATQHIREQIENVQTHTDTTVQSIKEVSGVISDVNEIVSTIAAAVTEQSAATKEIADNISSLSLGVQDANENVAQGSQVAHSISKDIESVNTATARIKENSDQVMISADGLNRMADALKQIVKTFRI